jgi:hypothetical protein
MERRLDRAALPDTELRAREDALDFALEGIETAEERLLENPAELAVVE